MSDTGGPESSRTLDRGLQVLLFLGRPEGLGGLSVSGLAAGLGISRTACYRLVQTLLERGFVTRSADGLIRLGPALAALAAAARPGLVQVAGPLLADLADRVGATAHVSVGEGEWARALLVVEPSWTDLHVAYRVGTRHPLTQGAAGRAILAGRLGEWGSVRTEGELQQGAYGVAAPVPGVPGLEASVGVIALGPLGAGSVDAAVTQAAAALAEAVGRVPTADVPPGLPG